MIGLLVKEHEEAVVEEFFQLFKTHWQYCQKGRNYPVIITTGEPDYSYQALVWIIFSSNDLKFDLESNIRFTRKGKGGTVRWEEFDVPIYGELALCNVKDSVEPVHLQEKNALGVRIWVDNKIIIRIGYDLFQEVQYLIVKGQPDRYAQIPTLDIHIAWLRNWIISSGIPVIEIPPVPSNYRFFACLTHDVDFIRIGQHKLDHSFWGFLYRSIFFPPFRVLRGQLSLLNMVKCWLSVFLIPFVFAGLKKDFWFRFEDYIRLEKNLKSTFFIIPFKNKTGKYLSLKLADRRATKYDVTDIKNTLRMLKKEGFEVGLHGIDAWHDLDAAKEEKKKISAVISNKSIGIRMHWLCYHSKTARILDQAGFLYDTTFGYNTTIGFRAGTTQVFRPIAAKKLLELPLHIQDMPLFAPGFLNLPFRKARKLCYGLIEHAKKTGGVLTILWHLRSIAPERFWDTFYRQLIELVEKQGAFFGTAKQIVEWFRYRRNVKFLNTIFMNDRIILSLSGNQKLVQPGMQLRITTREITKEIPLSRDTTMEIPLYQSTELRNIAT